VSTRLSLERGGALLGIVLAASTAACANETTLHVKVADGFKPGPTNVSVLGVFRDGRMSVDAWEPLALPISAALGAAQVCEPAFGTRLQRENAPLFASIDDDAKSDGITQDLLATLAPSAQGDMILSITMSGGLQTTDAPSGGSKTRSTSGAPQIRGLGGRGMRGGRGKSQQREATTPAPTSKALQMSASLYSSRLHQPMAHVTVIYTGKNPDDALKLFSAEVGKIAPGSACKGWSWTVDALPPSLAPLLDGP
jgi:hypothetical protein